MKGQIRGMGRGASVRDGDVQITMTSEAPEEQPFLRALFEQWFEGWSPETDAVLINVFGPMFERNGWTAPIPMTVIDRVYGSVEETPTTGCGKSQPS